MAQAQNKTTENDGDVEAFIDAVEHDGRREDARVLLDLFARVTGKEPKMWGNSIIGYGTYHYKYDSGREGDFLRTGFSPRKANMSIYIMGSCKDGPALEKREALLSRLGKHKMGKSCLYVTRLKNIDMDVLEELIWQDVQNMAEMYPE